MAGIRRPTAAQSTLLERRLLGSRFGRRLLLLFVGCALVPTCAVALLTFHSVRGQLAEQSWERLNTLSSAVGRSIYERLNLLESDLRNSAPDLMECLASDTASGGTCGADLAYGVDGLAWVPEGDAPVGLFGGGRATGGLAGVSLPALAPGQSTIIVGRSAGAAATLLLVHRPANAKARGRLVATLVPTYLLGMGDVDALPPTVAPVLWDPSHGVVIGSAPDSLEVAPEVTREMAHSATGSFEWGSWHDSYLATYWELPQTRRFDLPSWYVILSESKADVVAPSVGFARAFPLVLALSLVAVLILGATQIRRSLIPLEALRHGTRRIAEREFDTRVTITSGDEIEELASAFNAMATQLGRQFSALTTAAEIDRAVLSAMDTGAIVETVLSRVPSVCPCRTLAVTLLDHQGNAATTWLETGLGGGKRAVATATVTTADTRLLREHRECLVFGTDGRPLPDYVSRVGCSPGESIEVFPLFFGEELLGALAVGGRRAVVGAAAGEELLQLRRLADQVAVALSNARMVEQVRFMAFYDSLTSLPNRVLHKQRLNEALVRARRLHRLVAVCFLDLDHFSRINDTLGHDLGDRLVQDVATRLLASCREGDSIARLGGGDEQGVDVARLGGDEFTIILPDIGEPQDAARVARRILETFDRPFRLGTQEVFVSASVGIAIYPFDGGDVDDLLKNADVAMYHAKEQGRNTYRLFSASMNAEAVARMRMEQQLRRAVEANDFTMWYQPILDLRSREVVGAEALIRWTHKERGLVSPGEFMAISEESGLIVPLGEWILRTVCAQAKAWQDEGLGQLRMAINLSARQLRDDGFAQLVHSVLEETGLAPSSLVLELTESMLMDPTGQLADTLNALARMGVGLAIDDFGTGYSSLSYLKHFPVGSLKIDRSFVRDVTTNPDDAAITTAVIALARALNLSVVAEGVETREQAAFLQAQGCEMAQGYLIGRPADAEAFGASLRTGRSRADLVPAA